MTNQPKTRNLRICDILVFPRIRKKAGQIGELAADIREHGLINPITVMELGDGGYALIAGQRRLEAVRRNLVYTIRATVLSRVEAAEALRLEYAENEQRQDFTISERLEYAERIKAIEQANARERKAIYARDGRVEDVVARPHPEKGDSRDIIAKRVGIGSGRQLERAMVVAVKRPDLMEKIDSGETTIFAAYNEVIGKSELKSDPVKPTIGAPTEPAALLSSDQALRAKHERLMKNPLYADLYEKYKEAVCEANVAKGDRDFKVMCAKRVIRGHEENTSYMQRMITNLKVENGELRRRLGLCEDEIVEVEICST